MKKFLALVMALLLVMSLGSVAFADVHNNTDAAETHGNSSAAKVSDDGTTTSTGAATEMYLRVTNDQDDSGVEIEDQKTEVDASTGIRYELKTKKEVKTNISVTVPLYVCMYASNNSGKVTVPKDSAYQLKNESTYYSNETVDRIDGYVRAYDSLKDLLGEDYVSSKTYTIKVNNVDRNLTNIENVVAYNSSSYKFYVDTQGTGAIVNYAAAKNCTDLDNNGIYYYNLKPDESPVTITSGGTSTTYYRGMSAAGGNVAASGQNYTGLAVNVSSLTVATANGWNLRDADDFASLAAAKEFTMTLNATDLYDVANATGKTLSVAGNSAWQIPAPTDVKKTDDGITCTSSALPVSIAATIASGSVNTGSESGTDTQVIKVTYTLTAGDTTATSTTSP